MFTIDLEARVQPYSGELLNLQDFAGIPVHSRSELAALLSAKPGEFSVRLWNQLPGIIPIHTPPGEPSPKFRNKATAVERIWTKLCELYPDAVSSEDMPKVKERHAKTTKTRGVSHPARTRDHQNQAGAKGLDSKRRISSQNGTRKSAWAEELKTELRKRFSPGQEFSLEDIYKLIPGFQRRHKGNHHIAARLRTTLAQDLRGQGFVKSLKRGKYRMA